MRIKKEDSLLVLVDIQEKLFPHIANFQSIEESLLTLVKGTNKLNVPLVLSEQYKKGLGETLSSLKEEIKPIKTIEKLTFSCADTLEFKEFIDSSNKKNIILVGIESHICVLQTAIDLKSLGLNPIVVVDAIGSRSIDNEMIAIERMKQEGIILASVESILFELCREAGTEEFKFISKLVK